MKTALLIIDMLYGFLNESSSRHHIDTACEVINYCAK